MPNTFTLSGTSLDAQNNPAYVGRYMILRVKSVGTDVEDQASYPKDSSSFLIDENGDWSATSLWVNGDSGVNCVYEMLEPSGQRIDFIFPSEVAETTVRYEAALELYQAAGADPQLPINSELFLPKAGGTMTGAIETNSTFDGRAVATDGTKLDGIEALADVTDTANVTAAGALMDSELASPSAVKATTGTFLTADQTKLDGIEALADVTDATNVVAAGGYIAGGTDVAIADGGTAASTEAGARANLEFQTNVTGDVTVVGVTSYTVLDTDRSLEIDDDTIGGAITVNLPSAAVVGSGWSLSVKKMGSTYSVTIDGFGTETIDEFSARVMTSQYDVIVVESNGTNFNIVGQVVPPITTQLDNAVFDYVQFETAPVGPVYTAGRLHWDDGEYTLAIDTGIDDVTIQVGQENVIRVRNSTGATIINGSVVRILGATGNRPNIVLAQADTAANASGTIGMTTHDIENNTDGFVTTAGLVRDFNTSAYTEGDAIYLSSTVPGGLTDVEPTIQVQMGFVTVSNASTGVILCSIESHIPIYGSIYVDGGAVAQTIAQGATYTKSTAFTTDGNDSGGISDVANDQLVLTRGAWHITAAISFFTDTNSNDVIGALFLDDVEQGNLHFKRRIGTGSDIGSASIAGIVVVDQDTETLDLRLRHDVTGDEDITVVYANLNGHKISN